MKRSNEELWNAFFGQRACLVNSIASFDAGMMFEAPRIANAIFLLLGRGMRGHSSILDQLGIQEHLTFVASNGPQEKGSTLIVTRLLSIKQDTFIVEVLPVRQAIDRKNMLKFDDWWKQTVFNVGERKNLSRADLVRLFRDKDGGAHYNSSVEDPEHRSFLDGDFGVRFKHSFESEGQVVPWGPQVMIRQIGDEVKESIRFVEQQFDAPFNGYQYLGGKRFGDVSL